MISLRSWWQVTLFVILISLFAAMLAFLVDYIELPPETFAKMKFLGFKTGFILAFVISMPVAFKLRQITLLQDQLKKRVSFDELTGLYSRQHMLDLSDNFKEKTGILALIDIDFFKQINDNYGHQTGDIALKDVAQTMQKTLREEDIICRYGGEEFLAFYPDLTIDEGQKMAEKMRQSVAKKCKIRADKSHPSITISIGICLKQPEEVFYQATKRADLALYHAKKSGRNCVILDSNIPQQLAI